MSFDQNPYAPQNTSIQMPRQNNLRLADLGQRFLAALVDGLIGIVFVGPGYAMMAVGGALSDQQNSIGLIAVVGIVFVLLGALALLVLQVFLLVTRSQTIGKYLLKIQIVDFETGLPADFVHCFLLRSLVNGIIGAIPCLGAIYAIVDILFIFREDRRCIHDLLAQTCVVDLS